MNHLYWTAASTPNGDGDVMEVKWESMVSSECDLNLCLLLPAYASALMESLREEYCRSPQAPREHSTVFHYTCSSFQILPEDQQDQAVGVYLAQQSRFNTH